MNLTAIPLSAHTPDEHSALIPGFRWEPPASLGLSHVTVTVMEDRGFLMNRVSFVVTALNSNRLPVEKTVIFPRARLIQPGFVEWLTAELNDSGSFLALFPAQPAEARERNS